MRGRMVFEKNGGGAGVFQGGGGFWGEWGSGGEGRHAER